MRDILRKIRLAPYRRGTGPRFSLTLYAIGRQDARGVEVLGYELVQCGAEDTGAGRRRRVIFAGQDFCASPMHAIDSDQTIAALLGFLTLRLGDTDREYFAGYTAAQINFRDQHAETLSAYVCDRFGED